jgi:hypothetical protein
VQLFLAETLSHDPRTVNTAGGPRREAAQRPGTAENQWDEKQIARRQTVAAAGDRQCCRNARGQGKTGSDADFS